MTATERYFAHDTNWIYDEELSTKTRRQAWWEAGKVRTRAPAPMPQDTDATTKPLSKPTAQVNPYRNVYFKCGYWRARFRHMGHVHYVPGAYDNPHDAADGYNDYLRAHQIERPRLVVDRRRGI